MRSRENRRRQMGKFSWKLFLKWIVIFLVCCCVFRLWVWMQLAILNDRIQLAFKQRVVPAKDALFLPEEWAMGVDTTMFAHAKQLQQLEERIRKLEQEN